MKINLDGDKFVKLFILVLISGVLGYLIKEKFELDWLASWSIAVTFSVQTFRLLESYREKFKADAAEKIKEEKRAIKEEKRAREKEKKLERRRRKL
mmetsp:Transcript_704/g.858  ORF Transcript_704/g.858 Transcript_704/m.858 type:complete len:96 (-) Transcript_704:766-1053(-)